MATSLFSYFGSQLHETIRRPGRICNLLKPSAWRRHLRFRQVKSLASGHWEQQSIDSSGIAKRKFNSYEDYLELQRSKLEFLDLDNHENRFRKALSDRLKNCVQVSPGMSVLCLGARLGGEVCAFLDHGCFAVGVDLNPGADNKVVLPGDFQNLVFADRSIDIVYTNSLDHSFDLDGVCNEVARVLKTTGFFIVEADPGDADESAIHPDIWASTMWQTVDDLQRTLTQSRFALAGRCKFDYPRHGIQLVLQRSV